ncbi:MAG: hypothetical protein Q4D57_05730 [Clostridia bacterium]|nr:hypothetical protein [Clostridia bacterium]
MEKNYFNTVCEIISASERMKKFEFVKEGEYTVKFQSSEGSYEITYNMEKSLISMFSVGENDAERKTISSWLMEFDKCTSKDVNMIANDFIDIMAGNAKKSSVSKPQKKSGINESSVTGLFFANRMASMFPDLKDKIQSEKRETGDIKIATFTETEILPCVENFLVSEKNKSRMKKFGNLLSDLYHSGTLDTRSVITMGILNGINDKTAEENLRGAVSDELAKAWNASLKYKGKDVKPEKLKTRKSFMSKLLEAQKNMEK